jgi:hypothetical protein
MTATPTEVALKYQKKQPRPMLQDAAHNRNNKIAIGALIYVKHIVIEPICATQERRCAMGGKPTDYAKRLTDPCSPQACVD